MFAMAKSCSRLRGCSNPLLACVFAVTLAIAAHATGPDRQTVARSSPASPVRAAQNYGKLPLSFESNQGQADGRVKFLTRGNGYALYLTDNSAILSLSKTASSRGTCHSERGEESASPAPRLAARGPVCTPQAAMIQMQLVGANPALSAEGRMTGEEQLPGVANYLLGNDPAKWRRNIPTYAKVRYAQVYDGIDLVYYGDGYGNQSQLEYDFIVAPHADPSVIRLRFAGAAKLALTPAGDLTLSADSGATDSLTFRRPEVYQRSGKRRVAVSGAFELISADTAVFRLGSYDKSLPLVIDPTLEYATGFGGSSAASIHAVALDSQGNVYLAGSAGAGLETIDPLQPAAHSGSTGFLAEINAAGTALVYSTYFGGSGGDQIDGLAIDGSGDIYVSGTTYSHDFPTIHPLQAAPKSSRAGVPTGFVSEIKAGGASLVYSTYFGGSGGDGVSGIALDGAGDAYVAGTTYSSDFPLQNPIQNANNDSYGTGFVSEIAAGGTSLVYSTYLGGSGGCDATDICDGDEILAIAADEAGNAYVSGATGSGDFPTANALQSTNNNTTSIYTNPPYTGINMGYETTTGFVSKIQPGGGAFVYSTYLGGSGQCDTLFNTLGYDALISCSGDSAASIAADAKGDAYVAGTASSPDFPLAHPFQKSVGPVSSGFITVLNPQGSAFLYSTFLGGSGYCDYPQYNYDGDSQLCFGDGLSAIAIDGSENVYVAGNAYSSNVPLKYPLQSQTTLAGDGTTPYISALRSGGQSLLYSTYFGGSGNCNSLGYCVGDQANAIVADSRGDIVVAGSINSKDFPLANPLPGMKGGSAFLTKLSPAEGPADAPVFSVAPGTYSAIQHVELSSAIPEDIFYTTDGSTPTTHSAYYRWPIVVAGTETIKAIGSAYGYLPSPVSSAKYVVRPPLAQPVISVASGTYTTIQIVTVKNESSVGVLHYTLDGSTPTVSSTTYSGPIYIGKTETLRVIALASGYPASPIASANYTIRLRLDGPVLSLAPGTYTGPQKVAVTDATSFAKIFYTMDGATPNASSTEYTGPITIGKTETLKFIALATGYPPSVVAVATYTIK